jgi:hypothetical protein
MTQVVVSIQSRFLLRKVVFYICSFIVNKNCLVLLSIILQITMYLQKIYIRNIRYVGTHLKILNRSNLVYFCRMYESFLDNSRASWCNRTLRYKFIMFLQSCTRWLSKISCDITCSIMASELKGALSEENILLTKKALQFGLACISFCCLNILSDN